MARVGAGVRVWPAVLCCASWSCPGRPVGQAWLPATTNLCCGPARKEERPRKQGRDPEGTGNCGLCQFLHNQAYVSFCPQFEGGGWQVCVCRQQAPAATQLQFDPLPSNSQICK